MENSKLNIDVIKNIAHFSDDQTFKNINITCKEINEILKYENEKRRTIKRWVNIRAIINNKPLFININSIKLFYKYIILPND